MKKTKEEMVAITSKMILDVLGDNEQMKRK